MYFPNDMNFQYFFFGTYPGYFLQVLPIALIAGFICGYHRCKQEHRLLSGQVIWPGLFTCYITGLMSLTLLIGPIGDLWYFLFYHMPSGRSHTWFLFEYDLIPDFTLRFGTENLGNIVMFLPFGILYPLARKNETWRRPVAAGILTSLMIEFIQPVFGRSFDINDIILNGFGVLISASIFSILKSFLSVSNQR